MPQPLPERTPSAGSDLLSDQRAREALRRAAQLQAEAVERLEQQARRRIQAQTGEESEPGGFRREDVESAAVEAGISVEFIRQALLEQETLGEEAADLAPWVDRVGSRMLRTRERSIQLSRIVDAEPSVVLEAMQRVFPSQPYGMTLVDSLGGLPLEGGVLVFQLPRITMSGSTSMTPFAYAATTVDLSQLHVSLRAVPLGERTGCELTLRGDLRPGLRRNVWVGLALSGVTGGLGMTIAVTAAIASGALLPLLAGGAIAGLGGVSAFGYGTIYRYYLKKLIGELEMLLKVVDTTARTGGGFRFPAPPAGSGGTDTFLSLLGPS
ncbi:MAG: hypothetical protein JO040_02110 [Gemmatimonadetes bacterium]|nr:hypothetical protein [Gemmatimonadota bacterium]